MVITANDKLFVTNDSGTILQELDVFHPAARLVIMNATRLQEEVRTHLFHRSCSRIHIGRFFYICGRNRSIHFSTSILTANSNPT